MKTPKKKDNLTDLVDEAGSQNTDSGAVLQEGEATTPSGEVVTLGADDAKIRDIARRLVKWSRTKKGSEEIKRYLKEK